MKTTDGHDSELMASPPALTGAVPPATRPAGVLGTPSALPAAPSSGVDVFSVLRALRKRWALAVVLTALAAPTAALLVLFLYPAKYKASASLLITQEVPRVMFPTAEAQTKFEVFQQTQKKLITSRLVLGQVLSDTEIAALPTVKEAGIGADPYDWLSQELQVNVSAASEFMEVSLSGSRPEDLAKLVNTIVETYMEKVVEKLRQERTDRLEQLKKLWEQYQSDMKAKRENVRHLAVRAGSDNNKTLAVKQQLANHQLALIEQEKFRIESQTRQWKVEAKIRDSQLPESAAQINPAVLDQYVERVAEVKNAREEIAILKDRYDNARRIVKKGNDPSLSRTRQELEDALQGLETLRAEARTQILQQIQTGTSGQPVEKIQLSKQIEMYEAIAQELGKEAERLRNENQQQNEISLDLQGEQDDITRLADIAQRVGQEVQITEVEIKAPQRVTIVDKAQVPRGVDKKKKLMATATAAMGTLGCILFGISFWEIRARRISTVDQVINGLGLRVVGALPALPTPHRRATSLLRSTGPDWQSLLVESVDATRAMLLYASRTDNVRVVIVTSAQMGEGKTSLASHLAASLARAGRRTVLIDCDHRRPAIHRLFDLPLGPGVSELLRNEVTLEQILQPSPANHLTILTAGQADEVSMEAIGRGDLEAVFERLKSQFDFVIIDSAPILPVADTLLISQHADAAIFAIMHDVSRVPLVQAAYERLAGLGVPILGAVVAGTNDRAYYGSNSYYYQGQKAAQAS